MQPTLFTDSYTATRTAEPIRPATPLRIPRTAVASLVAVALAAVVLPATDAPADTAGIAPSFGHAGAEQVLLTTGYPKKPTWNFGQGACLKTGPART